jgi:hypothetical protein
MKQLTVWFDDPRGQMWVRKNLHFDEPIDHDRPTTCGLRALRD